MKLREFFRLCQKAGVAFLKGNMSEMGAALAYYTAFAVAPLLLIALALGGVVFGKAAARKELFSQFYDLIGQQGGSAVESLVTSAASQPRNGMLATAVAIGALCLGATGVFVELQDSLNAIWEVKTVTGGGWRRFIKARFLSFAMMLGIGFLLLVSLVLSSLLAAMGSLSPDWLPQKSLFWQIANFLLSLGVITVLFAMIYKVLPDVKIAWGDVWGGAFLAALLFNFGKFLIGFYLGKSSMASVYGAAGSLMILLTWVYYSAQILFFGAIFTRLHSLKRQSE